MKTTWTMKVALLTTIGFALHSAPSVLAGDFCASEDTLLFAEDPPDSDPQATKTEEAKKSDEQPKSDEVVSVKPLTAEEQQQLLNSRLDGGLGNTFGQFANMFLVASRIGLGTGVSLATSDRKIAKAELQPVFPESYKPTLHELMDVIALQTSSEWKYDPSNQSVKAKGKVNGPIDGIAIIEFTKRAEKREKPFEVTLADGWKSIDKGHWVMCFPKIFPVGMDIYEMGTYSSDKEPAEPDFAEKIRLAVALQWARRVNEEAKQEDLKPSKVGEYDALYYESMIPSQLGKKIRWRQWVFMQDNRCYFIVSTILPEYEDRLFPAVEKMVASIRIKAK